MTPVVSVVMPVWRPDPRWLGEAVASVLAERDVDFELLLVDDGNDEPLRSPAPGDGRVHLVRTEHGGASAARNAGIAATSGRYVRFVDSDDVIEPGSTAHLLALADGREDVITYGATLFCDARLRAQWTMTAGVQGDAVLPCLTGRFPVRPQALLFPRRVVQLAGDWDGRIRVSHDWDFVLRALEHAHVRGDHAVAVRYRKHGGSITSDPGVIEDDLRLIREGWLGRHPEQRGTAVERRVRAAHHAHAARAYLTRGRGGPAARHIARALVTDPRALAGEARWALPALRARLRG